MRCVLLTLLATSSLAAATASDAPGDRVEIDRWMVGTIAGQPAASYHELVVRHANGGASESEIMEIVLRRALAGPGGPVVSGSIAMRQESTEEIDAHDAVRAFRFETELAGLRTICAGTVTSDATGLHLRGDLRSLGRTTPVAVDAVEGSPVIGPFVLMQRFAREPWVVGATRADRQLLFTDRLQVATLRTTLLSQDGPVRHLRQVADIVPFPAEATVDGEGDVTFLHLDAGVLKMDFVAAPAAPTLLGGTVSISGLLANAGASPQPGEVNRYRLPPGAQALENEFQHLDHGILTVRTQPAQALLPDAAPFLRAEPRIECDDPALKAWAQEQVAHIDGAAARAEALRLAVRAYLTADLQTPTASALQTFRCRKGACTEHAALLCAALRAVGIPSRIEEGVVWSAAHGGWVGHAWNAAYVDSAWRALDSAFPGVSRSCYIALAMSSGDGPQAGVGALASALASYGDKPVETLAPSP